MKVCFIFGKGIDGCGVTRGALIFEKWLNEAGHHTLIIDINNGQNMARAEYTKFIGPVIKVKAEDTDISNDIVNAINRCDIAIFHSHPTRKQFSHTIDRYRRFVEKITDPIVVMYDHGVAQMTVNMVPQGCELFSHADIAVLQSLNGFSYEGYTKFDPGLHNKVLENPIWIDGKSLTKYYQPIENRDPQLVYIGRHSPLKDPGYICRIEEVLGEPWKFSLIGVEASISAVSQQSEDLSINQTPFIPQWRKKIHEYQKLKNRYALRKTGAPVDFPARIEAWDEYSHDWGMEKLGKSMASWCGYHLSHSKQYGSRMEYTVVESFLLTLPVIHRHFAETAKSPEGKYWIEYWGPLVSQAKEEKYLAKELQRLLSNKKEWIDRSVACKEIAYKFNDIHSLAPKFIEDVLHLGKRYNKINPIERIAEFFPNVREHRAKGDIIVSTCSSMLRREPLILVDGQQVTPLNVAQVENSDFGDFFL